MLKREFCVNCLEDAVRLSTHQDEEDSEVKLIFFFAVILQLLNPNCYNMSIRLPQEVSTLLVKVHPLLVLLYM